MEQLCLTEVIELHQFIETWLTGKTQKQDELYKRFQSVLANDFLIVHPSGHRDTKSTLVTDLWDAHGVKNNAFFIKIRNLESRLLTDDYCLVTYEEHQYGDQPNGRFSSALFRRKNKSKVLWVHLHETWLSKQ